MEQRERDGTAAPRRLLAAIVALEAAAAAAATAYLVTGLVTQRASQTAAAVWLVVIAVGLVLALGAMSRLVWKGRPGARGPVLTWQLVQVPVAWYMIRSPLWSVGSGLLVAALAAIALAVSPAVFVHESGP